MSSELKQAIQDLGETLHEFKKENDSRFELIKQGKGVGEVEAKLEAMNNRFDELNDLKERLDDIEVKGNRIDRTKNADIEEHSQLFDRFIRKGDDDGLLDLQVKAIRVGEDADGGYAVPESIDIEIEQLSRENNPMRSVCRVITASNEKYRKLVNLGGASSGWVGEEDLRPETGTPKLESLKPNFGEVYANPSLTQGSLDDIDYNIESWLAEEVSTEFAEQENAKFTVGNGTNSPIGILSGAMSTADDSSRAFKTIQYRLSGADGALGVGADAAAIAASAVDNLIDLEIDLKPGYRNAAKYMLPRSVLRTIRKLRNNDGDLIWQQSLVAGTPSMINGYAYIENEDMPAIAAESNSVMFGNFQRAYYIVDIRGTRVLRDPFTNKPYVNFYTTKRVGGMLVNSEAIKVLRLGDGS